MTKVVNIHGLSGSWETDERFVYIGRAGHGQRGYFGNPFTLTNEHEREEVYRKYVDYLKHRVHTDSAFREAVRGLAGKTLVCFCAPKRCHGDALAIMAEHLAR